ncbi:hypothetical protein, partial [Micromonospora sp. LOL_023]|uniref:hypothetical protein n=1 Tax=Micromonospora sp. LOL_023 TaxID=3345418 RepID=UPI003A8B61BC
GAGHPRTSPTVTSTGVDQVLNGPLGLDLAGTEETVDKLDIGEMAEIQAKLLFRLVEDAQSTEEQLDAFLLEAEGLLHEAHPPSTTKLEGDAEIL